MSTRFFAQWRTVAGAIGGLAVTFAANAFPFTNLYVFGDSLSDSGNDYLITGGAVPVGGYYAGGATVGRFTNGRNYADVLAGSLGLPLLPSVSGGTDYAYGGARTTSMAAGLPPTALNFNQQIGSYLGSHAAADPGALYVLWIGSNDMADAIVAAAGGNPGAIAPAIQTAMAGIGGAIQGLAAIGAQHFLVPNVPDLSLTPRIRQFGSAQLSGLAQAVSQQFNGALDNLLDQPGFMPLDIVPLDIYALQTAFTNNPAAYGFDNVTSACYSGDVDGSTRGGPNPPTVCATPDTYMYFDYQHPTEALHEHLGAFAYAAVVPEPAAWALWLAGVGLVAGAARARRG